MKNRTKTLSAAVVLSTAVSAAIAPLPDPGMRVEPGRAALLVTHPQNDFLSSEGVARGMVGKNVEANAVWTTEEAAEAIKAK